MSTTFYLKRYKLKKPIPKTHLTKIAAKLISEVSCEDRYFLDNKNTPFIYTKIRKERENEEKLITKKQIQQENDLFIEKVTYEITTKDITLLEVSHIHKTRTTAIHDSVIIHIDEIDGFGNYIEFLVTNKKDILKIEKLVSLFNGFLKKPALKKTYLSIFLKSQNKFSILLHKIIEATGKFTFGITGGVLTTLGIMVGLLGATSSKLAIIGGIVSIAIADSLSDSVSMYSQKKTERNLSSKQALSYAFNVFISKFIFSLSFIVSFLLFSFKTAVIVNIFWGLLIIVLVNLMIANIQGENYFLTIIKNTLITLLVIVFSYLVGLLINFVFSS